jgi:hypothetical protein
MQFDNRTIGPLSGFRIEHIRAREKVRSVGPGIMVVTDTALLLASRSIAQRGSKRFVECFGGGVMAAKSRDTAR